MNKDIWRTLTLCLILLLGTIHISAQSKPADGLVFSLDATQSVPRETIKGLPVEKIDEGSNTAYQAAFDASLKAFPKRSLVMRYKVASPEDMGAINLLRLKRGDKGGGTSYFEIMPEGVFLVRGRSSRDSEHKRVLKEELDLKDGETVTFIYVFDSETDEAKLVAGTKGYTLYRTDADTTHAKYLTAYGDEHMVLQELAVYDRLLQPEEINALVDGEVNYADAEAMDADRSSFHEIFFLHLAIIVFVAVYAWKLRKRRFKPVTADYVRQLCGRPLNEKDAREEALALLEEARKPWNFGVNEEGETTCCYPKSGKEPKKSRETLERAMHTGCTDSEVLYQYNAMAALHNTALRMVYNGMFLFVLVVFAVLFIEPILTGEFWRTVFSWKYMGYWVAFVGYIVASLCPAYVAYRGKEVEQPKVAMDRMANLAGDAAALAMTGGGLLLKGFNGFISFFNSCLKHSVTHFKVFRNGHYIGRTTEFNPVGLMTFVLVICAIIAVLVILWVFVMMLLTFAAIYKFVRNYVIKR